ncbi:MAG: alpha/beta hydrolase fold domain-containing protein [Isosphaeraceae bacterium]
MSIFILPGRRLRHGLSQRRHDLPRRPRTYHLLGGVNCLEERLLLSAGATVAAGQTAAVLAVAGRRDPSGVQKGTGLGTIQGVGRTSLHSSNVSRRHHAGVRRSALTDAIIYRNITYTVLGGKAEQLNVYVPNGAPPPGGWPVIMAIHGGGWRSQDNIDYGTRVASAMVPHGYVVIAPDYVLSAPGRPTWPLNLEDVQAAVRWAKINARVFGINPNEVVAMGESAGANLANLLGTASPSAALGPGVSAAVAAVISFSSPTDLTTLYAESPQAGKAVAQFLGGPPSAVPASYAAASPVDQVAPGDPPVFLVHGARDPLVPLSQSQELAAALTHAGVPNQLVIIPGGGHNLDFPNRTPQNLVFQILEFLSATWKDRGSHSLSP